MSRPVELDLELLKRLYWEEKKTINEVAAALGTTYIVIRKRMLKHGIPIRTRQEAHVIEAQRRGKPGCLTREFLLQEYIERRRSTVEIARELGISNSTVHKYMTRARIASRSRSERTRMGKSKEEFRKRIGGANSPNWKGGRTRNNGYVVLFMPDHPGAGASNYVFEHRLVMEKMLGRRLRPGEVVHHRNHVKTDNRPENLELFSTDYEHRQHHIIERRLKRVGGFTALRAFEVWLNRSCTWRPA